MAPVKKKKAISEKHKYKKKYSQEDVYKAVQKVGSGLSQREAAKLFKVPRSTLQAKLTFVIPVEAARGPFPYLTYEEEKQIVEWILYYSNRGFPITKLMLQQNVQKIIIADNRKTPFVNNKPGRTWYKSFMSRHPEISVRVCQNLNTSRVSATEEALKEWFRVVDLELEKNQLKNIDPSRVFNLDESAFFLIPKGDKVLAERGSKSVYKVVHGDEKESITVLFNVNASGTMVPPLILYWYERMPQSIIKSIPADWFVGSTDNGWMTADAFLQYIKGQFLPWLIKNNIERPVVLYVDGHCSHMTLELSMFCRENKICLFSLYPNATHVLQPLDVAVFHPLKNAWKKEVDAWRCENQFMRMKRENFAPLLKQTLEKMENLSSTIANGFRTCGLQPFSADAVDFNVLNKKKKPQRIAETITVDNSLSKEVVEAQRDLLLFEKRLDATVLQEFKNVFLNERLSISDEKNEGLFRYWADLKRLCDECL